MNDTRPLDARQQAELEARLRDQALARAQARLAAERGEIAQTAVHQAPPQVQPQPAFSPAPAPRPQAVAPQPQQPAPQPQPRPAGVQSVRPVNDHSKAHQQALDAGGLDFIGGERDVSHFLKANRHSGRVRFLRVALPLTAVFILSLVLGAYFWSVSSAPSVSVQSAGIENGRMVMKNPEINGVDEKKRPYNLVASEAITDPAVPSQVELKGINANVPIDDNVFANIIAGTGFYDSSAKTLKLGENIDITTKDGVKMSLMDADVDIDAGSLLTANPVSIVTEQAKISAEKFTVEKNGERVIFENRVKMTIYPDKFENADTAAASRQEASTQ